jgi:hypothetical protein
MRGVSLRVLGPVAVVAAAACSSESALGPCDHAGCALESSRTWQFQTTVEAEIDLLVVVDDAAVAQAAAPQLAPVLANLQHGFPSLHAAFIPATLPSDICSPPPARGSACGLGPPGGYLTTLECGQQPNVTGSVADAFSCLADLGGAACGPPQPLEAMKRALEGMDGFVRPAAALQVLIIAGGDDASAPGGAPAAVSDYVAFLKGLKADTEEAYVAVVGPASACGTGATPAEVAPRLVELVTAFGEAGLYASGCDGNYAIALEDLAKTLGIAIEPPCVSGVRDVDPATPGLQADCAVEDWTTGLDGVEHEASLPSCDGAAPPCWHLDGDPLNCGGGWAFVVDRGPGFCAQTSTRTRITCLACADASDPACAAL